MNDLTAHVIVKNEEQWIWYAIKSVIDYVDSLIIYDTGSSDDTVKIIKSFVSPKIKFYEKGIVTSTQLVHLRNQQIKETKTLWFMLLDGDEVWPKETILELIEKIKIFNKIDAFGVQAVVPIGDLYHYQPTNAGKYNIKGRIGHYNLRVYKNNKSYSWKGIYPLEAYVDKQGIAVQNKINNILIIKNKYWHLTHLQRSKFDDHRKKKFEIGKRDKLSIPEVFNITRPYFVPQPWIKYSLIENFFAYIQTPLKYLKRLIIHD